MDINYNLRRELSIGSRYTIESEATSVVSYTGIYSSILLDEISKGLNIGLSYDKAGLDKKGNNFTINFKSEFWLMPASKQFWSFHHNNKGIIIDGLYQCFKGWNFTIFHHQKNHLFGVMLKNAPFYWMKFPKGLTSDFLTIKQVLIKKEITSISTSKVNFD